MTPNLMLEPPAVVRADALLIEQASTRALLRQRIGAELEALAAQLAGGDAGSPHLSGTRSGRVALAGIQGRMRWLGQLLAGLADPGELHIHADEAGFGSTVQTADAHTGERRCFTLMTGGSIDVTGDQVPMDTPLGRTLTGCRAGDVLEIDLPGGDRRLRVERVTTLHEKARI